MKLKYKINRKYADLEEFIISLPNCFDQIGTTIFDDRNTIKWLQKNGLKINIKSFKRPHWINRVVYAYLRKSKAERSYLYAIYLENRSIFTPEPIAFVNTYKNGLLYKSFYLSVHISYEFSLRDLLAKKNNAENENIIRQFIRYTHFFLHKNRVYHLDYTPGNVLIKIKKNGFHEFNLVDLNRIKFKNVGYKTGIANFSKLWIDNKFVKIIATEYAKITDKPLEKTLQILEKLNLKHKGKILFKRKMKEKFGWNINE